METSEKFLTLNKHGSRGVVIKKSHYREMFSFIITAFDTDSEITFPELVTLAERTEFQIVKDNAMWYLLKVKQDLEIRGILRIRFMGVSPPLQVLRINRKALDRQISLLL